MLMTFNHRTFSVAMCPETLWGKYLVTHLPVWIKPESEKVATAIICLFTFGASRLAQPVSVS